ncbi:MAG: CDGSH iron-sulfur domain-containing protein [Blastocatellia bacterium]
MADKVEIIVNKNGSLRVVGDIVLKDADGNEFGLGGRTVVGLCRCGQSNNKPFCDGAHAKCGFESVVIARDLPAPAPKPAA